MSALAQLSPLEHRNAEVRENFEHIVGHLDSKVSRKNNFTFWHLIFKAFLAYFKNQKP